jgi:hypothetical protein
MMLELLWKENDSMSQTESALSIAPANLETETIGVVVGSSCVSANREINNGNTNASNIVHTHQ